jgi:hypothetical protein
MRTLAKGWATILAGARSAGREPPLDEGPFPLGLMRSRSPLALQRSNVPLDEARSGGQLVRREARSRTTGP